MAVVGIGGWGTIDDWVFLNGSEPLRVVELEVTKKRLVPTTRRASKRAKPM